MENYTPVNIGNGLYCDNGEGEAATPLPYPLTDEVYGAKPAKDEESSFREAVSDEVYPKEHAAPIGA